MCVNKFAPLLGSNHFDQLWGSGRRSNALRILYAINTGIIGSILENSRPLFRVRTLFATRAHLYLTRQFTTWLMCVNYYLLRPELLYCTAESLDKQVSDLAES